MGLEELPEVLLARKIITKYKITIPFDLKEIVKDYADLIYKPIPIEGVDGVSLNIKTPGKKPIIVVNSKLPQKRQLFTLAHELGHLIIPWHLGTIIDNIYGENYKNFSYSLLEQEANRFAAEILVPKEWLLSKINHNILTTAQLHKQIARETGVSDHAAAIRLIQYSKKNTIYIAEEFGIIEHTAKSSGSIIQLQKKNSNFDKDFYSQVKSYSTCTSGTIKYHWYLLETSLDIKDSDDKRNWKEILNQIAIDIQPSEGEEKFKKSINGIIAFAHGVAKREDNYNISSVISACIHRLSRKELSDFTSHPEFHKFIKKRVTDFF